MPGLTEPILEKRGYFWWHGEKTPKGRFAPPFGVPGVITVREDGRTRLNVTSSLLRREFWRGAPCSFADNPDALKAWSIAGKVDGGQRVYLRNIAYRPVGRMVDGKPSEEYDSDLCIVGHTAEVRNETALRFSKLSIELNGLEQWRWEDALFVTHEKVHGVERSREVKYRSEPIEYELEDGKISLLTEVHCNALEDLRYRDVSFRQYNTVEYSRTRATTPEALRQEFGHIEEFLAILTGTYYSLTWPVISMKRSHGLESYTLYFWRNIEKARSPDMSNLWTTFPQVRSTFGTLYSNWRKKRQQYGPGFYLYLGALRNWPMYIEHRFVNLMWGIESLHRVISGQATESKSQKKIVEGIINKAGQLLNSGERRWLDRELRISIEPPLEYRISSTFTRLPWKITKDSLDAFAVRCRIRRNNISHYGGSADSDESREDFLREVMELTEGLTLLYHAALLQEIGVDEKTLVDCPNMPIGFRIRRSLELAKLKAEGIKSPEPPDLKHLLRAQRKQMAAWRRRQVLKSSRERHDTR